MSVIGWRAWYEGGVVYVSSAMAWSDLPDDGLLVVMLYFSDGARRIMSGTDWYFKQGEVYGQSDDTEAEILARYPGAVLKQGKWTTDAEMLASEDEAMAALVL